MKLWMIFYFVGQVAAVVGPLPYDMEECQERIAVRQEKVERKLHLPEIVAAGATEENTYHECLYSKSRPELGSFQ